MLVTLAVAAGPAAGLLSGRSPDPDPRAARFLALAGGGVLGLQLALHSLPWRPRVSAALVISMWGLFVLLARAARALPAAAGGLRLPLAGLALNATVMALNGGRMPVWPRAVELAGLVPPAADDARHAGSGSALWWLGDAVPLPGRVISPGDALVLAGAFVLTRDLVWSRDTPSPQHVDADRG